MKNKQRLRDLEVLDRAERKHPFGDSLRERTQRAYEEGLLTEPEEIELYFRYCTPEPEDMGLERPQPSELQPFAGAVHPEEVSRLGMLPFGVHAPA